jgi:hypothetical protein
MNPSCTGASENHKNCEFAANDRIPGLFSKTSIELSDPSLGFGPVDPPVQVDF